MKIPNGISSFEVIRQEDYLYIDKTRYIEILEKEDAKYHFLIRPRRFGKSLFISLLENYYDWSRREQFNTLFSGLYIVDHSTPLRNSFLILKFSFAAIVTSESREQLIQSFDFEVVNTVRQFFIKNHELLDGQELPSNISRAEQAMKYLITKVTEKKREVFVLIDEYDNFANDLMGTGKKELYYDLIQSEGYVRVFYKALKDGTQSSISRIFVTGVSPIMLDDLTSGFNITENLTYHENLNEIMGFSQEEVENIINLCDLRKDLPIANLLEDMKRFYNGYLFHELCNTKVYNSDMVLYFLSYLKRFHRYPEQMLHDNVKMDYRKLRQLAFEFNDEDVVEKIITEGQIASTLVSRFSLEDIFTKRENFISLLFYFGMLTIKERVENELLFIVPNYVIKKIYWEYLLDAIEQDVSIKTNELKQAMRQMRGDGEISDFVRYLNHILEKLSNRDLQKFDEKYIKAIMMTLFSLDGVYLIESEYETEKGYVDIMLTQDIRYRKWINYEWMIELKYLKEKDRGRLEIVQDQASKQIEKYISSKIFGRSQEKMPKKVVIVVVGKEVIATVKNN